MAETDNATDLGMSKTEVEDLLAQAQEDFRACEESESENRKTMLEDLLFGRMGEQWEEADAQQRTTDGRPMLTINRMPTFIRQIVNDARQNKPSIKTHPVDDKADPDTAEILNGIVRNIEVQSKADIAYDTAIDSAVSCGIGYFRVDVEYSNDWTFDRDIRINRIGNPFTVYGDPSSTAADSSDWNVCFVTELLKLNEFEEQYPDADPVDFEVLRARESTDQWFQDKQVRVAEYWVRTEVAKKIYKMSDGQVLADDDLNEPHIKAYLEENGVTVQAEREVAGYEVVQYIINGQQILEKNEWTGKFIPIIPVYGDEVNIEGQRYFHSLIKFAKDSQRMYNYWRTAATELVALAPKAPWVGPAGTFDEDDRWETANKASHAYLEYEPVVTDEGLLAPSPQRQPFAGLPGGAVNEANTSSDDMKSTMGLYDASLGARSNETSGVAIRARKMEGDVSTFHFLDNMTRAVRHGGLVVLDLIPHVYNEARIMRIMGEDETPDTVPVNQPIPGQPMLDEHGQPQLDPETQQPVMRIYDLTAGRYDITVKAGPSFTTRREEAATQMTELLRSYPDAAPIIGDILAESLDWPRADEIAKRLKTLLPPGLQGDGDEEPNPQVMALQQQIQQGMQMLQQSGAELEALKADKTLENRKLDIEAAKADAAMEKVSVDMYRAENDRQAMEAEAAKDRADAELKLAQAKTEQMQLELQLLQAAQPTLDEPHLMG